jgi:hypothetical protein
MRMRGVAVCLLASGAAMAQGQSPAVIHVDVNLVQVDAVVTDSKNKHVGNLAVDGFPGRALAKSTAHLVVPILTFTFDWACSTLKRSSRGFYYGIERLERPPDFRAGLLSHPAFQRRAQ